MLAALIQERHDYVDTACLSACCRNDTFQILIMIIRDIWFTMPHREYVWL